MTEIVESDAVNIINKSDCSFCNWHYITIFFHFKIEYLTETVCLNTECTMSLIDQKFLLDKML